MLNTNQLDSFAPHGIERALGGPHGRLDRVTPPELAGPGTLVFASRAEQLQTAIDRRAGAIIADRRLILPTEAPAGVTFYRAPHVGLAMAKVLPFFETKRSRFGPPGERHPQSFVDPTAEIGRDVTIGAFAVVGAYAKIGDGCIVASQVTVERNAQIGARTLLHPQVFVGADCVLGEDCEIHPHATIGADGFGYAQDREFNHHKLPQLGRVVLGDRVEIGANTTIDRAAFTETRIGAGSKFDNLCHVAHNCEIGENAVVAGGFLVAGSTKIGRNFMTGGATVVADHVTITDGVVLAGLSAVTNKVEKGGVFGGYPLEPMRDHLRTLMSLPHLSTLRRQMNRVLKHLNLEEEK